VYFGAIGSKYRYDVTVIGDAVNVAARAAAAAEPFEVVVTGEVANELRADFVTTECDPIAYKGGDNSTELHVVHGASGGRARYVQRRRRPRRIAGRDRELRTLREAVDGGLKGEAGVVGVSGDPGAGKSFILAPVIDRWMEGGGIGLIGRCNYSTRTTPLAPVLSMFAGFLGLTGEETPAHRRNLIEEGLKEFELGEHTQVLVDFLARGSSEHLSQGNVIAIRQELDWERALAAVERFVRQRVKQVPVLYILEDLHHADSLTLRLVRMLAALPRDERFLFMMTYQPKPDFVDLRQAFDEEVILSNLGLRDSGLLVANMLNATESDDGVMGFLWERTRGNPGQLTELVRFLRDRGLLKVHAQRVVAPKPGVALLEEAVPPSLAQFALGRIEHLGEVERRLLRIASSIGRSFGREVLVDVAGGVDPDAIDHSMVSLVDEGVIAPEITRRPAYRFRDEITRAVTYQTIPESERREYHRRIANVLEKLAETEVDRSAVTLARHRERAGQYADAARWYLVSQWESVVERIEGDDKPSTRSLGGMAVRKFVASARHGLAKEAIEIGEAIVGAYWDVIDSHQRALVDLWLGASMRLVGRESDAHRCLKRAYDRSNDVSVRCDAALHLFHCYQDVEVEAQWWLDRAAELAPPGTMLALRVELARACLIADAGMLDEARIVNARIRDQARRRDHLRIAAIATSNLADCDLLSGDVDDALRGFEESIVMARALGTRTDEAIDQLNLGLCHLFAGRPDKAMGFLEAAVGISSEAGDHATRAEARVNLGMALALTDDIEAGEALCRKGLEQSPDQFVRDTAAVHLLHIAILHRDKELIDERFAEVRRIEQGTVAPILRRTIDKLERKASRISEQRNA
jgi:tetratricopeptide (TPR) repeat protein